MIPEQNQILNYFMEFSSVIYRESNKHTKYVFFSMILAESHIVLLFRLQNLHRNLFS